MDSQEHEMRIEAIVREKVSLERRRKLLNCLTRIDDLRLDFVELGLDTDTLSHIDSRVQAEYDDLMERRAEND